MLNLILYYNLIMIIKLRQWSLKFLTLKQAEYSGLKKLITRTMDNTADILDEVSNIIAANIAGYD